MEHKVNDQNLPIIVAGSMVAISLLFIVVKLFCTKKIKFPSVPNGTVLLHMFPRGGLTPSFSPFPLKLETYLRMAKIPYENDHAGSMSSKGKTPWMTYNGVDVADSQFCIDYLNKQLGVKLNSKLSAEERAVAHAFRVLMEDNVYWCQTIERWVDNGPAYEFAKKVFVVYGVPRFVPWIISRKAGQGSHAQGVGRHTKEELNQIIERNFTALSDFIGSKKFLMGDEPCEEDCAVFGILCQSVWNMPGTHGETLVHGKMSNLKEYCLRMKQEFWPDWDDVITPMND